MLEIEDIALDSNKFLALKKVQIMIHSLISFLAKIIKTINSSIIDNSIIPIIIILTNLNHFKIIISIVVPLSPVRQLNNRIIFLPKVFNPML